MTPSKLNRVILNNALDCEGLLRPQTHRIAQHLRDVGNISGVEASAMFKTRSLTRRIADLRDCGIEIKSEFKKDSTGQRYVRYVLS